ncbi:MAG: hypothetical protein LUF27_02925 [Lachnospiraceae bacterium]|nr:hypothetical protein [Lachnospiraceae bacterium]
MRMKKEWTWNEKKLAAAVAFWFLAIVCLGRVNGRNVLAEEAGTDLLGGVNSTLAADGPAAGQSRTGESAAEDEAMTEEEETPGTYTMAEGWCLDEELSTDDTEVYRLESTEEGQETSTISCSYMETNYSRQDYEQLREMLTNNLIYGNVNAQITTSAVYTLSMDYLYIVLVDDSSEDYCDIYHYVVGDYQCFCVQVREYRAEASLAEEQETDTPREVGQAVAEGFVWKE